MSDSVELDALAPGAASGSVEPNISAFGAASDSAELDESAVGSVFAALADPTRRRVVHELTQRPTVTASALADELPISRQAIAKHLAALAEAGLVSATHEGRETRYRLTPEPLDDAMRWMAAAGARWDERLTRLARRLAAEA